MEGQKIDGCDLPSQVWTADQGWLAPPGQARPALQDLRQLGSKRRAGGLLAISSTALLAVGTLFGSDGIGCCCGLLRRRHRRSTRSILAFRRLRGVGAQQPVFQGGAVKTADDRLRSALGAAAVCCDDGTAAPRGASLPFGGCAGLARNNRSSRGARSKRRMIDCISSFVGASTNAKPLDSCVSWLRITLTASATRSSAASHCLISSAVTQVGRLPRNTVKLIQLILLLRCGFAALQGEDSALPYRWYQSGLADANG